MQAPCSKSRQRRPGWSWIISAMAAVSPSAAMAWFLQVALLLSVPEAVPQVGNAYAGTIMVDCETTTGAVKIEVHPAWSPIGAGRFIELVNSGYFSDVALFRCISGPSLPACCRWFQPVSRTAYSRMLDLRRIHMPVRYRCPARHKRRVEGEGCDPGRPAHSGQ